MSESPTGQDAAAPSPALPESPPAPLARPRPEIVIDRSWKLWWIFAAIVGSAAPFVWWLAAADEAGSFGAMVLLMMSSTLIACAAFTAPNDVPAPHRLICWGGVLLEIWKAISIAAYYYLHDVFVVTLTAYVAITLDVALLAIGLWFVRRVILNEKTQKAIRTGLFAVLCGVLGLFMHVLYSSTFALALHDRAVPDSLHPNARQWVQEGAFAFREGTTTIDEALSISENLDSWPDDEPQRQTRLKSAIDEMMKSEKVAKSYKAVRRQEIFEELSANISNWRDITGSVTGDPTIAWRIRVVGHASDRIKVDDKNGEWKNYSVSEDRANYVYGKLRQAVKGKSVKCEWALVAVANADHDMGALPFIRGRDRKLSARVFVEKQAGSLSLLDYLYFMTYTITTTGYGDLVPTSSFAKFITCIANLFEILFIVVIINLVFTYGRTE